MKIKSRVIRILLSLTILSAIALAAGTAPVMAAQAKSVLTLTQELQTDRQGNQSVVLLAKLTTESGYPLSERTIAFFETSDLFGTNRVMLGSAVTSAVGIAALKYETRQAGDHTFTVVYSGDETSALSIVETSVNIDQLAQMAPLTEPNQLAALDKWILPAVGVVVVLVWGVLVGVLIGVIRGVRSGRQRA